MMACTPSFLPIFGPFSLSSLFCSFLSYIFHSYLPLPSFIPTFLPSLLFPSILFYIKLLTYQIVAGYGLTETSPTLLNRVVERNVLGTVGQPPIGTEIKVIDPDTREEVPIGQGGILVRTHRFIIRFTSFSLSLFMNSRM